MKRLFFLFILLTLIITLIGCNNKKSKTVYTPVYTLTVKTEGLGEVTPEVGAHKYSKGTVLELTATPAEGWQFKEWIGEVVESQRIKTKVLMDKDKTVKAKFMEIPENTVIESITDVNDVEAPYGTSETEALSELPGTTIIRNNAGGEHIVDLSWTIKDYDGDTAGEYEATGTFELPEGIEQSDPPMNLEVTAMVTVLAQGSVTGVSIIEGNQELGVGVTMQLSANNHNVSWSSSNQAVVTVNSSGQLEAIATGIDKAERTAVITVTTEEGNYTDEITVTVTTHPDYFNFNSTTGAITGYNPAGGLEVVIPSVIDGVDVSIIGDEAFKSCGLTGVIIPDGVRDIKYGAFCYNDLTAVEIPGSVNTIGVYAFYQNSLAYLVIGNGVITIKESAFNHNQLSSVTIPGSVSSIGDFAFRNNKLTGLTLNFGLESIGHSAFVGNSQSPSDGNQLTRIIIPDSVITIESGAFATNTLESVIIGNNVRSIGPNAFWYNQLEELILPDSVNSIGEWAFSNNSLSHLTIGSGLTSIGEYVFNGNSLASLDIPATVTSIESAAFNSNQLTSLVIPDTIETISSSAFANNLLTELTIGSGLRVIADSSFINNNLTSLTIPDNIEIIEFGAFINNSLTEVTIGSNVTSIGQSAFINNELTSLILPGSVNLIGSSAFQDNPVNRITIGDDVTIYEWAFSTGYDNEFRDAYYGVGSSAGTYTKQGDGSWEKTP